MSLRPHPPALAVHEEDAEALRLALEGVSDPTDQDRTVGAAELLRIRQLRTARVALLARIAREVIFARRQVNERRRNHATEKRF